MYEMFNLHYNGEYMFSIWGTEDTIEEHKQEFIKYNLDHDVPVNPELIKIEKVTFKRMK